MLPTIPGVRETFVGQFLKQLKLKALAVAKYLDAEPLVIIIIHKMATFLGPYQN